MTVQADGLSFNVEVGQTVLARAHLHHQTNFRTYAYNPPEKLVKKSKPAAKKGGRRHQRGSSSATEPDSDDEEVAEAEGAGRNAEEEDDDDVPAMTFEISLSALLNCLNIFGDTTVKPISARQQAARDKWKTRQTGNENGGGAGGGYGDRPPYGRRSSRYGGDDDEGEDGDEGPQLRDEALFQRDSARGGSTVAISKKKTNIAMVLSWQEEGCPLVLL